MRLDEFDEFSFISDDNFNSSELNYYNGYAKKYEEYEIQRKQLKLEIQSLNDELACLKNKLRDIILEKEKIYSKLEIITNIQNNVLNDLSLLDNKFRNLFGIEVLVFTSNHINDYMKWIYNRRPTWVLRNNKYIQFLYSSEVKQLNLIRSITDQIKEDGFSIVLLKSDTTKISEEDSEELSIMINKYKKDCKRYYQSYNFISQYNKKIEHYRIHEKSVKYDICKINEALKELMKKYKELIRKRPTLCSKKSYEISQYDIYMDQRDFGKVLRDCFGPNGKGYISGHSI